MRKPVPPRAYGSPGAAFSPRVQERSPGGAPPRGAHRVLRRGGPPIATRVDAGAPCHRPPGDPADARGGARGRAGIGRRAPPSVTPRTRDRTSAGPGTREGPPALHPCTLPRPGGWRAGRRPRRLWSAGPAGATGSSLAVSIRARARAAPEGRGRAPGVRRRRGRFNLKRAPPGL